MKKALVVFLILAVAGGLFAQLSFSGSVETGIAVGMDDKDNDESPKIDFIRNRGEHNMASQLNARYSGEGDFGKYGADVVFLLNSGLFSNGMGALGFDNYYVWWEPSPMLNIRIGKGGQYDFGLMSGFGNLLRTWQEGLYILSKPADGVQVAAHVFYGAGHNGSSGFVDKLRYGLGFKYGIPILDINAALQLRTANDPVGVYFGAGAKFKGVPGLGITLEAQGFDFASDKTNVIAGVGRVDYAAGALSLGVRGQLLYPLGSEIKDTIMPMTIHGEVAYKVSGITTIGVQARYLTGRTLSGPTASLALTNYRNAGDMGNYNVDGYVPTKDVFFKDNKLAALGISPEITFTLNKPTIKLGWNLQYDATENAKPTATKETMRNLFYAQVNVSF